MLVKNSAQPCINGVCKACFRAKEMRTCANGDVLFHIILLPDRTFRLLFAGFSFVLSSKMRYSHDATSPHHEEFLSNNVAFHRRASHIAVSANIFSSRPRAACWQLTSRFMLPCSSMNAVEAAAVRYATRVDVARVSRHVRPASPKSEWVRYFTGALPAMRAARQKIFTYILPSA